MAKIKKTIGRPAGAGGKKSEYLRDHRGNHFRCSQGFHEVCEMLVGAGMYKSRSDIYHEAVMLLAAKKTVDSKHWHYWKNKIQ